MTPRIASLFLGALLLVVIAVSGILWLSAPVERPNVLLITIDSLRADHLGLYGYDRPTSPNLDEFARSAVVFDQALTQATLSGPSHATMFTSTHVPIHGVINNGVPLEDDRLTLAEALQSAGYETAMFVSHPFVGGNYGLSQGFDVAETHTVDSHGPGHRHEDEVEERGPLDGVFVAALEWLERPRSRPFFLWLHAQHVHKSYEPPSPYDRMFGQAPPASTKDLRCRRALDRHTSGKELLDSDERDHVVALYDGEIAYVDTQLGKVLAGLRAAGLEDDTIVVVTSDHGEMLFDDRSGRATGHGHQRYDKVLRVPLIVKTPGATTQRRVDTMVGLIDLAPTLLELAGVKSPSAFTGTSLVPSLDGREQEVRQENLSCTFHEDGRIRLSIRTTRFKLICDRLRSEMTCSFFDLDRDPGELENLVRHQDHAEDVLWLGQALEKWFTASVETADLRKLDTRSKQTRRLLQRAGYLPEDPADGS